MTDHELQEILDQLALRNIPKNAIAFLLVESSDSHEDFLNWVKQGHAPNHPELPIKSPLQALLFYWTTEFDWCTQIPIWEAGYTELEYTWIQLFMNAFQDIQIYRTTLNLNLN